MEKIIHIREQTFPAKSTAASLFSYKANFNRDGIRDLLKLAKEVSITENEIHEIGENFDIDVFYRFLWTFAKAANREIPPLVEWLEQFDIAPFDFLKEALPQVQEMLSATVQSQVKAKN